jgi:hypothetical protein
VTGTGEADITFPAHPGSNEASVTVAAPGVTAETHVEAWVMGNDSTTKHTAADHRYFAMLCALTCAPGTDEFTIHGRSEHKLSGAFRVHYVWANS